MKDTAYYYPAPYWLAREGDRIKSLLLFFDDVAILLPDYMWGRHRDADPSLAGPLEEQGLLRILEPKEWIDAAVLHQSPDKRGVPLPVKMVSQLTQTWHSQVRSFC